MGPGFFFLLFFGAIFIYLLVLIRNFIVKERASKARLNAQFTLLNSDLEKIKENVNRKRKKDDTFSAPKPPAPALYPPEKNAVIKEVRQGKQVPEDYDFAIHLYDGAEQFLGKELYQGFESRVAAIPGIESCLQDGNNIFLIQGSGYSEDILTELFWREFLHAAELNHLRK